MSSGRSPLFFTSETCFSSCFAVRSLFSSAITSSAKVEAEAVRAETEEARKAAADYRARFLRLVEDQMHVLKADNTLFE